MPNEVTTIILRFRDLSTEPGETIEKHQEVYRDNEFVWWGWWNKSGEQVPMDVFNQLKTVALDQGLRILLFDSWSGQLYSANCTDIQWNGYGRKDFPDDSTEHIPQYYRNKPCLAWFRIEDICEEPNVQTTLNQFSYVTVAEFFDDLKPRFEPFHDKMVYSNDELKQQDRTIWFIRPYNAERDSVHEISIFSSSFIKPEDFPKAYIHCSTDNLMWVSDLHFSNTHHAFPVSSRMNESSLAERLEKSLETVGVNRIGGLIISGDVTWQAEREGFEMSKNFLRQLNTWASLPPERYILCPGNHDIGYTVEEGEIRPVPDYAKELYVDFYKSLFNIPPNQYMCSGRRFIMDTGVTVEIACLNSLYAEQRTESNFRGHGFIGQEQRDFVTKQMGWDKQIDSRAMRIVVLHHHLLPVSYSESPDLKQIYSTVLDAEALSQWIVQHNVKLVLHGHMHEAFYAKVSRAKNRRAADGKWHDYYVVGLGSTGVIGTLLGRQDSANMFGIMKFSTSELEIKFISIDPTVPSEELMTLKIPYEG